MQEKLKEIFYLYFSVNVKKVLLLMFFINLTLSVLVSLAYAATQPDILSTKINGTSVSTSKTITLSPGGSFTFYILVENNGDDSPAGYNNITISFPSLTSSSYKSNISYSSKSSDLSYTEYFGTEAVGGDGYANYIMIEAV